MILILNEAPDDFGDGGGKRLLPVLQLDSAKALGSGTRIRTAGGDVFEVKEDFDDIAALVDALLAAPVDESEFDEE